MLTLFPMLITKKVRMIMSVGLRAKLMEFKVSKFSTSNKLKNKI